MNKKMLVSLAGWIAFIGWAFLWITLGNEPWYLSWPLFFSYLLARHQFRRPNFKFPRLLDYWYHTFFMMFFIPGCLLIFVGDEMSILAEHGFELLAITGAFLHAFYGLKRDHLLIIPERPADSVEW